MPSISRNGQMVLRSRKQILLQVLNRYDRRPRRALMDQFLLVFDPFAVNLQHRKEVIHNGVDEGVGQIVGPLPANLAQFFS